MHDDNDEPDNDDDALVHSTLHRSTINYICRRRNLDDVLSRRLVIGGGKMMEITEQWAVQW